ncbi:5'-nucleotidase [uncultured Thiohalocapsa sp.]|uniref:5'-nucleotidase n=1 Tax=uncultured Thiohalocapsa sp. TaxID=768990 RepID=UPI0025FD8CC9|nr:5'-nucleotidase [uncultured Thiohalocapsa sp.]
MDDEHRADARAIRLTVAISSRALFDLDESHAVFEQEGVDAYHAYQVARENEVLAPGVAFALVQKLLALNERIGDAGRVEIILLSRNSSDTGLRVFNSIRHHGLEITRAAFTNGASPYRYVSAFDAHLFLSADPDDVRQALAAGCAAATLMPAPAKSAGGADAPVRIAFDGDAVLFSDEAERVYRSEGLAVFNAREVAAAAVPLSAGPFKGFLLALHRIQALFPPRDAPLRTALITARGAPSHERVIRTLRDWGIRIDEALFLGGLPKGAFLEAFDADIYFDDQEGHCADARGRVATGHVPHGIANAG